MGLDPEPLSRSLSGLSSLSGEELDPGSVADHVDASMERATAVV